MRIVIIGATSTIATECERIWAQVPNVQLVLVGRNAEALHHLQQDLTIRYPQVLATTLQCDFNVLEDIERTVHAAGNIDVALIAHGQLVEQEVAQSDLLALDESLRTNATSVALFAEAIARRLSEQQHGTLAIIGSVAGDRARRSNYSYGAAKAFVESYTKGLQHRFAKTPVNVVLIKPGPTTSKMTLAMPNPPKGMATAQQVAQDIVKACAKNASSTVYTPRKWQLIMLIIRMLPTVVFNKLNI